VSIALVSLLIWSSAFSSAVAPGPAPETPWTADYGVALEATRAGHKPLLVVIDQETQPAVQIVSHQTDPASEKLLARYELCHIDATTPYGQDVARRFKAKTFPHVSIIDATGKTQLFIQRGEMTPTKWEATLARYASGSRPASQARRSSAVCKT